MPLRILIAFFFFNVVCDLSAQQYNFRPVTAEDGLPGNECHFIRQDSKGYMWISTDAGLVKYNGVSSRTFTKANGLTDNTVFETNENANGKTFYSSGNSELGYI
ncbi:MAG TPA: hypothetical protein VFJ43_13860, partial [Bacteroidia bacterium]|nr:hypothetical protein [Bacteroidia bacterium]